ncbi:MAG: PLD nuclease N-terminal domain-containing protein [Mariniphaga sp.]|jgi:hypothetical protein|nr:PLD nuclease N-terminal domain-containing protein [Mariniphaga sp.]
MEIAGFIGPQELIIVLLVSSVMFVLPIIALVDILKNEFEGNYQLIWVIVILLSWFIGAVLYYFIGRNQKLKK